MDSETPTTMRVRFSFLRVGERNEKKIIDNKPIIFK
jgi:hypothetical protein